MQRITFISFKGEIQTVDVEEKFFNNIMNAINDQKIVCIKGKYYKSAYFDNHKEVKENNVLKLPEVEISEEKDLKIAKKLKK